MLPTEVPITVFDSRNPNVPGDGKGPIYVSLDRPDPVTPAQKEAYPDGRLQIDRLGSDNLTPLITGTGAGRTINPVLAANNIQVIKDTHGKTSHLSAADIEALSAYLRSLQK